MSKIKAWKQGRARSKEKKDHHHHHSWTHSFLCFRLFVHTGLYLESPECVSVNHRCVRKSGAHVLDAALLLCDVCFVQTHRLQLLVWRTVSPRPFKRAQDQRPGNTPSGSAHGERGYFKVSAVQFSGFIDQKKIFLKCYHSVFNKNRCLCGFDFQHPEAVTSRPHVSWQH